MNIIIIALLVITVILIVAFLYVLVRLIKVKKEAEEIVKNTIVVLDTKPVRKENETENSYKRRCVLKLQNEIAKADAISITDKHVKLKILK